MSRSAALRAAGYTRRKTWHSLPKDGDMTDDLPPTPLVMRSQSGREWPVYTADWMRAYGDARAAAAVAQERERCAQACDEHASIEGIAQNCAAAIRKGE